MRRPELDGVRALAALAVLAFHAVGYWGRGAGGEAAAQPWVGRLDVGVTIFFLLSGYLLYCPFLRGSLRLGEYAWRRLFRIVPAYWVALTVAALALPLREVWDAPVWFFGFLQTYRAETAGQGLGQAWTLCVEVAFYAFLPLWAWLTVRTRSVWPLLGMVAFSVAYKLVVLAGAPALVRPLDPALIALPAFLDFFALGMGLALLEARGVRPSGSWWWWGGAVALFLVGSWALGDARLDVYTHGQWLARHALYGAVALLVLAPAVAGRGGPARVLGTWPLARLGEISYGLYLYHLLVLMLLAKWGFGAWESWLHPYALWLVGAFVGSVLLATASWVLVERPLMALRPPAARRARARRA
ncbi:acyltransferase family protein [Solirubrobacter deserti]|uniref:Acyltransferase n=1 Tax=Solirubrobacter deserti TaxID=2282478 RepID=A0ABT4RSL3_9ACTN|nr:acyltransferase [Solirubrobacter deserti]MDA0141526.1 acyltransferase [Solirubrobacter deserti]